VTSVLPNQGPTAGGTSVTIAGTGFTGATAVAFGGTAATSFVVTSATQITATAPASSAGAVDVTVASAGGTSTASAADRFTYVGVPTVTSVSPASGTATGGTTVTLTGTNFSGATAVSFGLTAAISFTINSPTSITATSPAGTGTVDIRVTATGGTSTTTAADHYSYIGPPVVTSISPSAGAATGGTVVTIVGNGFSGATSVLFGGTPASSFTVNSASSITATSPAGTGTVDIRVSTIGGISAVSGADQFGYTPAPDASSFTAGAVAYNSSAGAATSITLSTHATNTPTNFAVGSATTSQGGTVSVNASGVASYTPPIGFRGSDSFSFTATNAGGTSAPATVTVPVANPTLSISLNRTGATAGVPLSGVAVVTSGGKPPYSCSTAPAAGALPAGVSLNTDCSLNGTPTGAGTAMFSVDVTDSSVGTGPVTQASAMLSFTVTALPPVAATASANVPYNTAKAIDLSGAITGVHTSIAIASAPAHGTTQISGDIVTYTPTSDYFGPDNFTYTATGPGGTSAPATVTLTVAVPNAPSAAATSASIAYNAAKAIDLSGAIVGVHNSISIASVPAHGTASVSGDVVTYTPASGYFGPDSFAYTANGPGGSSAAATVTLSVATPGAPTVSAASASVAYDTAKAIDLSTSINGVHSGIAVASTPAHGITSVAGNVITYTPTAGYFGTDSFTYTATGPGGTSAAAAVSLTVATPAAPVAASRSGVAIAYHTSTAIDLSTSISGVHSSIAITAAPAHGTATVAGDTVTYTPAAGYFGADSFAYAATGPGGTSAPALVSLTVATPAAPVAAGRSGVAVTYGGSAAIDLSTSISGVHLSVAITAAPAHGSVSVAGDIVTYTPTTGYFGADSFAYAATGPGGTSAPATVGLNVATPAPPTATNKTGVTVPFGSTGVQIDLSSSVNGVHSTLIIGAAPAHGSVTVGGDVAAYVPAAGYFGVDSFSFSASGPGGTSAPATVSLTVSTPPAPVVADKNGVAVPYNSPATMIDLSGSVSGIQSSIAIGAVPSHGTITLAGGTATYIPTTGYFGADAFTFTATGPGGTSRPATVSLVVATPPPPVAKAGSATVVASAQGQKSVDIDLSALISGEYSSVDLASSAAHGTAVIRGAPAGGGRVIATYTPTAGFSGTDSFNFVAVGPGGRSSPAAITITVAGSAPTAAAKTAKAIDNQTISVDLTEGATEGPFTAATIVGVTPADKAKATVVEGGSATAHTYRLDVTPAAHFGGTVVVTYTLSNQFGTSAPATVTISVVARPDPALDPNVRALSDAQAESTRRFAQGQSQNFLQRAERLHNGGGSSKPQMGISIGLSDVTRAGTRGYQGEQREEADIADRSRDDVREGSSTSTKAAPSRGAGSSALSDPSSDRDGERRNGSLAIWSGGQIEIGTQDRTTDRDKISMTSSGLSAGADLKLSGAATVGVGGGVGFDSSKIGGQAASVRGDSTVIAGYGSLAPLKNMFVDFVVGYGDLSFKSRRAVGASVASGSRDGSMWFGAASAGIDRVDETLRWSLYGRGEWLDGSLGAYIEQGAGMMNLRFDARNVRSLTGVLGGRFELEEALAVGVFRPRLRAEWSHEFQNSSVQRLDYADISGAAFYGIATEGWTRDQYEVALGGALTTQSRWIIDFELGLRGAAGERDGRFTMKLAKEF
jgi:hypothetical protein